MLRKLHNRINKWIGLRRRSQTCPRREEPGPWLHQDGIDYWRILPNGDWVCSFCGSLHPIDFEDCIDLCLEDVEKCRIDNTDKHYKFYVRRPEVENAAAGGIKFYTQHLRKYGLNIDDISFKLSRALKISLEKSRRER